MRISIFLIIFYGFILNAQPQYIDTPLKKCKENFLVIKELEKKGVISDTKANTLLKTKLTSTGLRNARWGYDNPDKASFYNPEYFSIRKEDFKVRMQKIESILKEEKWHDITKNPEVECLTMSIELLNRLNLYVKEIASLDPKKDPQANDPLAKFIPTWRAKVFLAYE